MNKRIRWSAANLLFLQAHYATKGPDWVAAKLGTTANAICTKAYELDIYAAQPLRGKGANTRQPLLSTTEQLRQFTVLYENGAPVETIAQIFNWKQNTVRGKAQKLGLRRPQKETSHARV